MEQAVTVEELINKLQEMPPKAEVWIGWSSWVYVPTDVEWDADLGQVHIR